MLSGQVNTSRLVQNKLLILEFDAEMDFTGSYSRPNVCCMLCDKLQLPPSTY